MEWVVGRQEQRVQRSEARASLTKQSSPMVEATGLGATPSRLAPAEGRGQDANRGQHAAFYNVLSKLKRPVRLNKPRGSLREHLRAERCWQWGGDCCSAKVSVFA